MLTWSQSSQESQHIIGLPSSGLLQRGQMYTGAGGRIGAGAGLDDVMILWEEVTRRIHHGCSHFFHKAIGTYMGGLTLHRM